ncbi:hypothetical protein Moror_2518 [Moniliophthora roreri MCA 2997]|uniref:Uncharacterized protein n=1 Tax=Moniliophthora roreri (strain MCA 2997) TaxID=1381753 RepID=V2XGG7_MONRO|nr:hypothetical protein Moror_2518 [Moniliophthora roreri MCA 2997]
MTSHYSTEYYIQILYKLLHGSLDMDSAMTLLTAPTLDAFSHSEQSESVEDSLWMLWAAFNRVAGESPASDEAAQGKLVECLAAIKRLPPVMVINEGGEKEQYRNWGGRVWDDLPIFGANMREDWNWFDPPETDPERNQKRTQWINLNAFVARITDAHVMDFELYAIWALRRALEENEFAEVVINSDSETTSSSSLDADIPTAAQWIFIAGSLIYSSERAWILGPGEGNPARGGPLLQSPDTQGFSRERWQFWKNGFAQAGRYTGLRLNEKTKTVARKAYERMGEIESEGQPV